MAKANIDPVTTKLAKNLVDGMEKALKTHAIPSGMEQVGPKELAKRWPHLGDAQRQRIRQDIGKQHGTDGVDEMMQILRGGQ